MRYFFGILVVIGAAIGAYFAIDSVLWQHRAIQSFAPTDARVHSSEIQVHRGRRSTSYSPVVTYTYTFNGRALTSFRVLTFDETGSSAWARAIVKRFPAGAKIIAYVNPDAPAESILIREYSSTPYLLSFVALFTVAIGTALLLGVLSAGRTAMQAIPFDTSGFQLLLPTRSLRRRRRDTAIFFLLSGLPSAALLAHFLFFARQFDVLGTIVTVLCSLAILIEFFLFVRAYRVSRHVSDARLQISPAPMILAQPLQLRAELDAYVPLHVKSFCARVLCIEHYRERRGQKTVYGTCTRLEKAACLAAGTTVSPGQIIAGETQFEVGPDQAPPSRDLNTPVTYPWYSWEIRLDLTLTGASDYHATFPLTAL